MKRTSWIALSLALVAPSLSYANRPTAWSATIDEQTGVLYLNGEDFARASKKKPLVLFAGTAIPVTAFTDNDIQATLPGNLPDGNYLVAVLDDGKKKFERCDDGHTACIVVTLGAQGLAGPPGIDR